VQRHRGPACEALEVEGFLEDATRPAELGDARPQGDRGAAFFGSDEVLEKRLGQAPAAGAEDPASRSECIALVLAADVREGDAQRLE